MTPPPVDSIVTLLAELVRIPSRAAQDSPEQVMRVITDWLRARRLGLQEVIGERGETLGVYAEVGDGPSAGPWIVLNAMLDTAPFGDVGTWTHGPTSADIVDGWLYGRGSADAKAAVALFAHLIADVGATPSLRRAGRLGVLFDVDEHTGGFGGARAFFGRLAEARSRQPGGVIVGYPGLDAVVIGGRGFLRATLTVHGKAAHSGASRSRGLNAIDRAIVLASALSAVPLPPATDDFGLPPQITLTAIHGGESFSQVPDRCRLDVDIRLTPSFGDGDARRLVERAVAEHDARYEARFTAIEWFAGWPAFRIDDAHPMVRALQDAARAELGRDIPAKVAGPSNIGNFLSTLGVPTISGFGVHGENFHGADERVAIDSIGPVYRIYRRSITALLDGSTR
jgi:succinyl-diaminopimelate desuccinylase